MPIKRHFVIFYSPGTFVSESSELPVDSWNVDEAVIMSKDIKERHGALPYGFSFITKARLDDELDSKITERSHMYYLGGEVLTLEDVKARKDSSDRILISNMEMNHWDRIIVNSNSWQHTAPLMAEDVVLHV